MGSLLEQDDISDGALDHFKILALVGIFVNYNLQSMMAYRWIKKEESYRKGNKVPNPWQGTIPTNAVEQPKEDREDPKAQAQESIKNKLFNRNSVFRPPARPKR